MNISRPAAPRPQASRGRRPAFVAALAATAALALVGCSATTPQSQNDGPVDLRMVIWSSNEAHLALFNEIADGYIAENADTVSSVTFEPLTGSAYASALTTQIAGGDSPDLAWIAESYAPQFVASGVLADVSDAFDSEEFDIEDVVPGALDIWTLDDRNYGYPFSNSPFGIYVNKDLLAAAGQEDPRALLDSGEWTWDALATTAAATAESTNGAGLLFTADPYSVWNDAIGGIWQGWGAAPWSEDGAQCTFDSPEMNDFFDWFHEQVYTTGAIPGPGEEFDFASGQAAFKVGQLSGSSALGDKFNWDFLPLPEGPAGVAPVVGQGGVAVIARGDNPEIAADFLAYFVGKTSSEQLAEFFPPARESLLNVETLSAAAPALNEAQIQQTVIDQALNATTKAGHVQMSSVSDRVRAGLDAIWTENADIPAALTSICGEIEPFLTAAD